MMLRRFISLTTVTCLEGLIRFLESEQERRSISKDLSTPTYGIEIVPHRFPIYRTVLPEVLS
jgi:hypothetical protein